MKHHWIFTASALTVNLVLTSAYAAVQPASEKAELEIVRVQPGLAGLTQACILHLKCGDLLSAEVVVRNRSSTVTAINIQAYNIPWDTLHQFPVPPMVCDVVPPGQSCQIAFDPSGMTCPTAPVNVAVPIVIQGDNTAPVGGVSIFMIN